MIAHTHIDTPAPERSCIEADLDRMIERKQRRQFMVSFRVAGRRVEQPVTACSTSEAARIAFDEHGLTCASVRPLP